jgi:hypothetical protein
MDFLNRIKTIFYTKNKVKDRKDLSVTEEIRIAGLNLNKSLDDGLKRLNHAINEVKVEVNITNKTVNDNINDIDCNGKNNEKD